MALDMVCTCGVDGMREAEDRRLRIFHRMGLDRSYDLTTAIILSLAFDFGADALVEVDQWFGVSVVAPLIPDGIYIECDSPEDGLAAIWEHLADKFPNRVSVKEKRSAFGVRVVERVTSALFEQYAEADGRYREHRSAAHKEGDDWCEDCHVLFGLCASAHVALCWEWGSHVMDPAVEKAFER